MILGKICLQPCRFRGCLTEIRGVRPKKRQRKVQSLDIIQDRTRIFNGGKPIFRFCPKTEKGLKCKGDRSAYEIVRGLAKAPVTGLRAFSASGMMCPPMLLYPYRRIPLEITKRAPDDWRVDTALLGR
jgi:hypothetical protein